MTSDPDLRRRAEQWLATDRHFDTDAFAAANLIRDLFALIADQAQQIDRVLEQRDHEIALGQDEFRRANRAEAALLAARRLPEKWLWQGAAIDTVHATMSTGYHACAAELLAAFDAPQNRAKGPCT